MQEESKIVKEKRLFNQKSLFGYYIPNNALLISMIGIFIALNFVVTYWIQIPIPATGGYINIGDIISTRMKLETSSSDCAEKRRSNRN